MSNRPRLILPPGVATGGHARRQRNPITGRLYLCCLSDCSRPADDRYQVRAPHEHPRWRAPDGTQEMVIWTFCSEPHKVYFAQGTKYAQIIH
jgi:hypothetical protein